MACGRLTDWLSLGVLTSWVPRDAVGDAIEAAVKGAKRSGGKLPPHVMAYFAMALAWCADDDHEEVIVRLTETLRDWGCWDESWSVPTSGGITPARQWLGYEPVKEVFAQVAAQVADEDTPEAFLGATVPATTARLRSSSPTRPQQDYDQHRSMIQNQLVHCL